MGNTCSQPANCTIGFDEMSTKVVALGGVPFGNFEADPDIAGIGTVVAVAAGTAFGLSVGLIMLFGLILDRIPKFTNWSYRHPFIRYLVPSPSQLLPKEDWPRKRKHARLSPSIGYSSSINLNPAQQTGPEQIQQYPSFPGAHGGSSIQSLSTYSSSTTLNAAQHTEPGPSQNHPCCLGLHGYPSSTNLNPLQHYGLGHLPTHPGYSGVQEGSIPFSAELSSSLNPNPVNQVQAQHILHHPEPLPTQPQGGQMFHQPQKLEPGTKSHDMAPSSTSNPSSQGLGSSSNFRQSIWGKTLQSIEPGKKTNHSERITIPERSYDVLEAMLCCIHDAQLLLAIAIGLSFYFGTNCSMSQYHLDIAMNLSLIGCISFLQAFTLVRNYWASPIASFIRMGCFVAVIVFLSLTSMRQQSSSLMPEYLPPIDRKNSLILLDAACFSNKTYGPQLNSLTKSQKALVGTTGVVPPVLSYYRLVWAVAIASICSGLIRVYQFLRYSTNGPARQLRVANRYEGVGFRSTLLMAWWIISWASCAFIYGVTCYHVYEIRIWVDESGWVLPNEFSRNPENNGRSFSQIAAVVVLSSILIAGFDRWKPKWWKTWANDGK